MKSGSSSPAASSTPGDSPNSAPHKRNYAGLWKLAAKKVVETQQEVKKKKDETDKDEAWNPLLTLTETLKEGAETHDHRRVGFGQSKSALDNVYHHLATEELLTLKPWYIIMPSSNFKQAWDTMIVLLVLYNAVIIPLAIGFSEDTCVEGTQCDSSQYFSDESWKELDHFTDAAFGIDIVLNFFTAYATSDGKMEFRLKYIALQYLWPYFLIDLLATIPFELFGLVSTSRIQVTKLLKLPRLVRLSRVVKYFENFKHANLWRVSRLLITVVLFSHWNACFYHLVISASTSSTYYVDVLDEVVPSFGDRYFATLYSVFLMQFGGDSEASTGMERLYACVGRLTGGTCASQSWRLGSYSRDAAVMQASIFSNVAMLLANRNAAANDWRKNIDGVNESMRLMNISEDLQVRIRSYFEYLWNSRRGDSSKQWMLQLTDNLYASVLLHQNRHLIANVRLFQECDPKFVMAIIMKLKSQLFLPKDWIMHSGTLGREMFFINKGVVEMLITMSRTEEELLENLHDGGYFGEVSVILGVKRITSARAKTYVDLNVLSKEDFDALCTEFEDDAKKLAAFATIRLQKAKAARQDAMKRLSLHTAGAAKDAVNAVLQKQRAGRRSYATTDESAQSNTAKAAIAAFAAATRKQSPMVSDSTAANPLASSGPTAGVEGADGAEHDPNRTSFYSRLVGSIGRLVGPAKRARMRIQERHAAQLLAADDGSGNRMLDSVGNIRYAVAADTANGDLDVGRTSRSGTVSSLPGDGSGFASGGVAERGGKRKSAQAGGLRDGGLSDWSALAASLNASELRPRRPSDASNSESQLAHKLQNISTRDRSIPPSSRRGSGTVSLTELNDTVDKLKTLVIAKLAVVEAAVKEMQRKGICMNPNHGPTSSGGSSSHGSGPSKWPTSLAVRTPTKGDSSAASQARRLLSPQGKRTGTAEPQSLADGHMGTVLGEEQPLVTSNGTGVVSLPPLVTRRPPSLNTFGGDTGAVAQDSDSDSDPPVLTATADSTPTVKPSNAALSPVQEQSSPGHSPSSIDCDKQPSPSHSEATPATSGGSSSTSARAANSVTPSPPSSLDTTPDATTSGAILSDTPQPNDRRADVSLPHSPRRTPAARSTAVRDGDIIDASASVQPFVVSTGQSAEQQPVRSTPTASQRSPSTPQHMNSPGAAGLPGMLSDSP